MEFWDAYDQDGKKTGQTLVRGEPVPDGLYHLVSCVLIRHTDGDFLLLRRAPEKEVWPNIWEIGAGGSALVGEDALTCAKRELYEETGIACDDLQPMNTHVEGHAIYAGFLCVTDIAKDAIRLQAGENTAYRWLNREAFLAFFHSDDCIDRFRHRLGAFVQSL